MCLFLAFCSLDICYDFHFNQAFVIHHHQHYIELNSRLPILVLKPRTQLPIRNSCRDPCESTHCWWVCTETSLEMVCWLLAYLLSMRMKTGVGKTFAFVFAKKSTISQHNVIDFISRTLAIQSMPFLGGLLPFSIVVRIKNERKMKIV